MGALLQCRFCPHIYRMQKVPCKPWDRRVPRVDELETELAVHGVSLSTKKDEAIRIESLATSHLAFKRELLQGAGRGARIRLRRKRVSWKRFFLCLFFFTFKGRHERNTGACL